MWSKFADFVLKNRLAVLILIGIITVFMGFQARKVENTYDFIKVVPPDDVDMLFFNEFTKTFGEDGNILVIGLKDSSLYQLQNFKYFSEFCDQLSGLQGVNQVLALPKILNIEANRSEEKFVLNPIFKPFPIDQQGLDSLLLKARNIRLFADQLLNFQNGATLIALAIDKKWIGSAKRHVLIPEITKLGENFSQKTKIDLHYAGIPYVRTLLSDKVRKELNFFLMLSLGVTLTVLYLFFRSFSPVIFPMLMIGIIIVWTLGTLGILGYKITLLTGLLPPILVVIGIPNSIYLLNRYHQEFVIQQDKIVALKLVIKKIGIVTVMTNLTTAIGFMVLIFTDISILKEFGIVAGINILATFIISLTFIPAIFSYLPSPKARHLKHLDFQPTIRFVELLIHLVSKNRPKVYAVAILMSVISIFGIVKIKALSFMVDDMPQESQIVKDLRFFEKNFKGVMPIEIVIDTQKRKGIRKMSNLQKIDSLQNYLQTIPYFSAPLSSVTFLKAANQAYFNGSPDSYSLPTSREGVFIQSYLKNNSSADSMTRSFVDTSGRLLRISLKVADLGSIRMDSLIQKQVNPQMQAIFADSDIKATITGTTLLFIKGNRYLIQNMQQSLALAIFLIALIMGFLFKNFRMVIISLIPNLLPLAMVAGMMGFLEVPLKPSTALIFSIAFGIAVDDSIHFLAKYRQELIRLNFDVEQAVQISLRETGMSMMYTSIVLFAGFVIFVGSEFGGTVALGALTSTTLLIAMFTNLILLPSLLLTFRGK
ncbi:MAG: hypothetical protein EAZ97_10375 [Bacteroidetes bacterium]|nr:MAG: hypothetical protein EAZ97_10375 [Bacteroidota bacterium]